MHIHRMPRAFIGRAGVYIISAHTHRFHAYSPHAQGDAEIDTSKVDSTRRVEDYDEATQAEIRKITVGWL